MDQQKLSAIIAAVQNVCPINGIRIIDMNDKDTWSIQFSDAANATQRLNAQEVLVGFDIAAPTTIEVNAERDRRMGTFQFMGKSYQLVADSQVNISGAGTLALAAIVNGSLPGDYRWSGVAADFYWLTADNTQTLMDAQAMLAFTQTATAWKRDHIYAARVIKNLSPIPADYADNSRWPSV